MNYIQGALLIIASILLFSLLQFIVSVHPPKVASKTTPGDFGFAYEQVRLTTSDNLKLDAWFLKGNKNATVIVGHGYPFDKGNIIHLAKFLHPEYNLLFYDHRYFGKSQGSYCSAGYHEVKDVQAAVEYVNDRFGKNHKVALYGFSLSASTMLMSDVNVNAIIADSPFANAKNMLEQIYPFGPLKWPFVWTTSLYARVFFGVAPDDISPANAAKEQKAPILLIHGRQDSQIPFENAEQIKAKNPKIQTFFVDADHGMAHYKYTGQYEKTVKEFLKASLS